MSTDRKKYHQGEAYCNCTLTYCKRLVTVDTRYRHRRKMQRLSEEKALIAAASNSEEKRNIGTSFEKRDTTSLQDRTVEQNRCAECFQCAVYRMLIVINSPQTFSAKTKAIDNDRDRDQADNENHEGVWSDENDEGGKNSDAETGGADNFGGTRLGRGLQETFEGTVLRTRHLKTLLYSVDGADLPMLKKYLLKVKHLMLHWKRRMKGRVENIIFSKLSGRGSPLWPPSHRCTTTPVSTPAFALLGHVGRSGMTLLQAEQAR
ncbi:hypothetical protein AYX15_06959 [Cryptococcus neoformans]|nr:hypothetical protein AYX15_06959 [Cryptococcus neoformans var. grubii]